MTAEMPIRATAAPGEGAAGSDRSSLSSRQEQGLRRVHLQLRPHRCHVLRQGTLQPREQAPGHRQILQIAAVVWLRAAEGQNKQINSLNTVPPLTSALRGRDGEGGVRGKEAPPPPLCPRPRAAREAPLRSLIGPWRRRGRGAPARGLACPPPPRPSGTRGLGLLRGRLRLLASSSLGASAPACPHPPRALRSDRPCLPLPSWGPLGRALLPAFTLPGLLRAPFSLTLTAALTLPGSGGCPSSLPSVTLASGRSRFSRSVAVPLPRGIAA